ncbi:hypothetical protein GPECTOR_3g191 [Gonium pectorale]|uniref:Protein-S-isoprenylcysteine O-methyltransferase n=1 Tax=Gonium pectorale TaxID=33097 RepID=A0A150H0E0_GONPE|nr:hypothetical protein GPECTOR_3g191 [Gonium pectorale]|eukprot:KXZ55030.1 hypothetical protein GPECTOR_3g191 [Gonium pectorale]
MAYDSDPAADDDFARAWKPPPGDPPLWWVEKFEAKRKEEARRKAEDPSFTTTLERVSRAGSDAQGGNPALRFLSAVLQVVQLLVVLSLLLLLPAVLHDGGLALSKPWSAFAAYLAFFGLGSVARVVGHGRLAPRKSDRQVSTWGGRLAFAAFVMALPLLHMSAMYRFAGLALYTNAIPAVGVTLYDAIGGAGFMAAIVLNAVAANHLGPAYDRVTAPPALVTSGPYRFVQHPIYTSYMLLFFSYGMFLHSAPTALAMLLLCVLYYKGRTALESRVLEEAFGSYYRDYAARTKKFVPFLV